MTTLRHRLEAEALRESLRTLLVDNYESHVDTTTDRILELLERELLAASAPIRKFTAAHLGLVYLLAEQQGATHARLRRLWDAKATRARSPWPWISDSGVRTRCSELVAWGLVESTGARGESPTGRPSAIWTLIGVHPAKLGRDVEAVPGVDEGAAARLDELLTEAGNDVLIRSQLELAAEVAGIRRDVRPRDTSVVDEVRSSGWSA